MEIKYKNLTTEYLKELSDLVINNKDILKPNTLMVYYIVNRLYPDISFVALVQGKVIGFVVAFSNALNQIWLHQLAVDVNYRGNGIGKELIRKLESASVGNKINFSVKKTNTSAISLYEKLGYKKVIFEEVIDQLIFEKKL